MVSSRVDWTNTRTPEATSTVPLEKTETLRVVVVAVDSHILRIVLVAEKTTVTQQVSHIRLIKCQSRLWSQRGTEVNGSHHGDNPLLRPTGIQIATKSYYAALQTMTPTNNIKTVHHTSLLHIESNLDRLGMLSPTHDQRSQCGRCYAFGCMVAIRGGYRMAHGWHYTKLSLSSALLSFSGMCILLLFLSFLFVVFVFFAVVFFFCSRWSCCVDVPLIFFCPADHVCMYKIGNHVVYYWVWLRPDRLM